MKQTTANNLKFVHFWILKSACSIFPITVALTAALAARRLPGFRSCACSRTPFSAATPHSLEPAAAAQNASLKTSHLRIRDAEFCKTWSLRRKLSALPVKCKSVPLHFHLQSFWIAAAAMQFLTIEVHCIVWWGLFFCLVNFLSQ